MPRIVHVISTPTGVGGAERVVAALLGGGAARGWEQLLLNPFGQDGDRSGLAALCEASPYASHACSRISELPGTRRWLAREIRNFHADVVHAHLFHAIVTTATVRFYGAQSVLTHHHGNHLVARGRRDLELLDRIAGLRFRRVVAVSEEGRRFLLSRYRYRPSRVVCIPNGWRGEPPPRSGLASHPTVVCVANFRAQKGHEVLLSAFEHVRQSVPDAQLILIGHGEGAEALRARASDLGLTTSIRFEGAVDDVWPYLAQAHVFCLPSRYEPFGIAVLEAMAAGVPVVASDTGGLREVVEPGVTGELVAPGDEVRMADHLIRLLRSPDRRNRMGAAGRKAAEDWRLERTIERYFDLYGELLSGERT